MELKNPYRLVRLAGVPYLLPYGQAVADHRRGVRMDERGEKAFVELLAAEDEEAFIARQLEGEQLSPSELEEARQDLLVYLDGLCAIGVLGQAEGAPAFTPVRVAEIAGLRVGFAGRVSLLAREFEPFFVEDEQSSCDMQVTIAFGELPCVVGASVVIQTSEIVVLERSDDWVINFRTNPNLRGALIAKDGSRARFYVQSPLPTEAPQLKEDLFHAIRFAFLVLAQQHDRYVLHSCSVAYRDRAILFSGSSGTGKSTHAELWHKAFGVPLLNGDLNVLYLDETGKARACGLPWCGTSGICVPYDLPLGGVVLLRQAPRDQVQELTPDEAQLFLMNRFISPSWTEEQLEASVEFAGGVSTQTAIIRYLCTKDTAAAQELRSWFDAYDGESDR